VLLLLVLLLVLLLAVRAVVADTVSASDGVTVGGCVNSGVSVADRVRGAVVVLEADAEFCRVAEGLGTTDDDWVFLIVGLRVVEAEFCRVAEGLGTTDDD
jgi:hypothetical protein